MTRIISVIGGKGGIGKTTLVSNLSCALAKLGKDVVAIDANMTTPNLGLHLGMHLSPKTLHDVLKGKSDIESAAYPHPAGFRVIPGSMATAELKGVDIGRLPSEVLKFFGKTDFVILDSAAGLGREALSALQSSEEVLVITNPDLPSVADALKTIKIAEDEDKSVIGIVLNKVSGRSHELTSQQVETMLGHRVLAEVPENEAVPRAISAKMPVFMHAPKSGPSHEFNRIAHALSGRELAPRKTGFLQALIRWFSR